MNAARKEERDWISLECTHRIEDKLKQTDYFTSFSEISKVPFSRSYIFNLWYYHLYSTLYLSWRHYQQRYEIWNWRCLVAFWLENDEHVLVWWNNWEFLAKIHMLFKYGDINEDLSHWLTAWKYFHVGCFSVFCQLISFLCLLLNSLTSLPQNFPLKIIHGVWWRCSEAKPNHTTLRRAKRKRIANTPGNYGIHLGKW